MIPMPPDLAARWSAMWPAGHHPERPWWQRDFSQEAGHGSYILPRWTRCDGQIGPALDHDPSGNGLLLIDREHPLPAPPPMPGQAWASPCSWPVLDGTADARLVRLVTSVEPYSWRDDVQPPVLTGWQVRLGGESIYAAIDGTAPYWPPPGAFLVAGPTPWGRDVPWGPA